VAYRDFETWVFDLDNTLYPATADLFSQIDARMKVYISKLLNLEPEEAFALQKRYYHTYGTSLRGLMNEHAIDPADFLAYVHDIDHGVLAVDRELDTALSRIEGRKLIYTNGSQKHAENVLLALGLHHHFEAIYDITAADFVPKPQQESYDRFMTIHGVDPRSAIFFEDTHKNLIPAHAMGMTTVLVRNDVHWSASEVDHDNLPHCDHVTEDLRGWLADWLDQAPAPTPTPTPTVDKANKGA
jgi:putative hydrolase of the HAD superfamily